MTQIVNEITIMENVYNAAIRYCWASKLCLANNRNNLKEFKMALDYLYYTKQKCDKYFKQLQLKNKLVVDNYCLKLFKYKHLGDIVTAVGYLFDTTDAENTNKKIIKELENRIFIYHQWQEEQGERKQQKENQLFINKETVS